MLVSGTKYAHGWTKIMDEKIWERTVTIDVIDNKPKFDGYFAGICFKAKHFFKVNLIIVLGL